jgi:2-dehydropantoate 2-reductase
LGQVPHSASTSYLFVGNGIVSKHFQFYFNSMNIPFRVWTRNSPDDFYVLAPSSERILVLINDDEIENFILKHTTPELERKIWVHFSGILSTTLADSAHPLMTFTDELYDLETYKKIPFITENGRKTFYEMFPELNNPTFQIQHDQMVLYHAFCVMSGNYTTILWQKFFEYLESQNIPASAGQLYLKQIAENLTGTKSSLTGPLQRNDFKTIFKHLEALEKHPMKNIYNSFVDLYKPTIKEKIFEKRN